MEFAKKVALVYGVEVAERSLPPNVPASMQRNKRLIQVNRDHRPERQNFSALHELAHYVLGHPENNHTNALWEKDANEWASDVMLPDEEFRRYSYEDLDAIKEAFPHASYEVIARKLARRNGWILTIYDRPPDSPLTLYLRLPPERLNCPEYPIPQEREAVNKTLENKSHQTIEYPDLILYAYYIDDPPTGYERVILLTEVMERWE